MSVGVFTERRNRPADDDIRQAIGARLPLWEALIRFVREKYPVQEDFTFLYGKNYGWAWRFRIKGQLLTSLYPAQGRFVAQVNLSPAAVETALGMKLGENVHQAIARAHPYPEGRWLFVSVESEKDLEDVQRLLALRAETNAIGGVCRSRPLPGQTARERAHG
jgi:Protein of unknown function (DUF3788)